MHLPGSEAESLREEYHTTLDELGCDVACLKDGTPLPLYDRDAMKGLFGDDE